MSGNEKRKTKQPERLSAEERSEAIERLARAIEVAMEPGVLTPLSSKERLHIHKPYKGVEAPAAVLARLAVDDPRLVTGGLDPNETLESLAFLDHLTKVRALLSLLVRAVDDTTMVVRKDVYQAASMIHMLATFNIRVSPELAEVVQIFDDFLCRGDRQKKPKGQGPATGASDDSV